MAAGGGRRWKDNLEPDERLVVRHRMAARFVEVIEPDQRVNLEAELRTLAADVEEAAFSTAQSKVDYLRMVSLKMQSLSWNLQQQMLMQIAHRMQWSNPVHAIQGGDSLLPPPQAASVMATSALPPAAYQQPNRHVVQYHNFNSQTTAMFAPMAPHRVAFGQQIVHHPMPSRSQDRCRAAVQIQHASLASYYNNNPACVAQLQGLASYYNPVCVTQLQAGQPVVGQNNAQTSNHLLNQHYGGGIYGTQQQQQQQPAHFIMRNQEGLSVVNQHRTNYPCNQIVGVNNVANKLNIGYPEGFNSQQNAGCAPGLQQASLMKVRGQDVLKMHNTNMELESQLTTPPCGQVTADQQGNVHRSTPQTKETTNRNEAVDWREERFQHIESLKTAYFSELMEFNRMFAFRKITEEQLLSLPKYKVEAYKRNSGVQDMITSVLNFLQLQKRQIPETYREKFPMYEAIIHKLLDYHRRIKAHMNHRNSQTINVNGDTGTFNAEKSSQQNQPKQLADASISQARQTVVTTTQPPHLQGTDSSDPQGLESPCFSAKSPGGLRFSETNDVGACCTPSPLTKSGVVQVASPYGSMNSSTFQSSIIANPSVGVAPFPCVSMKSSLESTVDNSRINLATSSTCSSVKSTLPSRSEIVPVASPCDSLKSTAPDDNNSCHQVTPKMILPASLVPAQTAGNQTEDEVCCTVKAPPVKKPMERLIDAVRNISPEGLRIAYYSMKSALATMDAVPLPPPLSASSNNRMKRAYDVTSSSYSESPPVGSSLDDVPGAAAYNGEEHGAKRQKTQNAKAEVLMDEIEAINNQLIDTTVSIVGDNSPADEITSCNSGTLIKLSYTRVSLAPSLKSHPIISGMQPLVMPVALLVPADYPASSPTIVCDEADELLRKTSSSISKEVDSAFRRALRDLPEPRSLKETTSVWDACVRRAVTDFVQKHVGCALGSRLVGRWERCIDA